tara:strand:+ start:168 stop:374 length:207 start_codon:yes stop_codon:yes gene_type:complete
MKETEIIREINALEEIFQTANSRLAVLKMALVGRGNPKAPNRESDPIEKATDDAILKRRKNRLKKSHL